MKKQITSSVMKGLLTSAILVSVLFMNAASAAEKNSGKVAPYELKYVGELRSEPVFQLDIENSQKQDVYIKLEDEVGNLLYADKFNEQNFSKKFQFDLSAGNSTKIRMTLVSKASKQTQLFEINNVQKVVENVVVTKVN